MKYLLILCLFAALTLNASEAFYDPGSAPAGSYLDSYSEVYFSGRYRSLEAISIKVPQIYGLSLRPKEIKKTIKPGAVLYVPCQIENLGNGTDKVKIKLETGRTDIKIRLLQDNNNDGIHEFAELASVPSMVSLGEGAVYGFFVEVAVPAGSVKGEWGWGVVTASSSGADGPEYLGYNGTRYGGADKVSANISISVE